MYVQKIECPYKDSDIMGWTKKDGKYYSVLFLNILLTLDMILII